MVKIVKHIQSVYGHNFECAIKGSESPSILLINGAGGPIEGWLKVWEEIGNDNVIFAYNRLGIGNSSKPSEPQTGEVMVRDLKGLLIALKIEPPYLIVGHSLGGFIAQLFAHTYPSEVCGVVFLESSTISDVLSEKKHTFNQNKLTEVDYVLTTVHQIQQFDGFPNIPIVVIAGSKPALRWFMPRRVKEARLNHQIELTNLSLRGRVIIAKNSGHFPQLTEPQVVIDEVNRLLLEIAGN
ncbi:MAG: alpha/beta hydrolase [Erysipelotrichaceae bacterium]|nr:alpha/beta hydrolase [Erysipelotrichaceae bacterium]